MAGVEELAASVRTARSQLPSTSLEQAAGLIGEAVQALTQTGSQQPEVGQAISGLSSAAEGVSGVQQLVNRAGATLSAYLRTVGADAPPDNSASSAPSATGGTATTPQPTSASPRAPDGQRLDREQADALRGQLPPTVPRDNREGKKTHGRWIDENGQAHAVVSGRDEQSEAAWQILKERGIPLIAPNASAADVEQKAAAQMVADGRKNMDLVINNVPCPGKWGCDNLVPVILPAGYTLTVHGPGWRKSYSGGSSPWRR